MNGRQALRTAGRLGGFCARRGVALVVVVGAVCVLWTATYFALLLVAIATDDGLGGPFAYPAGLLFFFVVALAAGLVLLLPSTALAAWLGRRRGLPVLAQIPLSVAALALLCLAVTILTSVAGVHLGPNGVWPGSGVLFLALLVPLGLYWWTAQSVPLVLSVCRRLRRG